MLSAGDQDEVELTSSPGTLDCVYSFRYKAPTMLSAGDQNEVELELEHNQFHLILVTIRQHRRYIIPQAVNTV